MPLTGGMEQGGTQKSFTVFLNWIMTCLKCQGRMLVERHYSVWTQRLHARCINCGFWLDLADVLRFFKRILESGYKGLKIRESL